MVALNPHGGCISGPYTNVFLLQKDEFTLTRVNPYSQVYVRSASILLPLVAHYSRASTFQGGYQPIHIVPRRKAQQSFDYCGRSYLYVSVKLSKGCGRQ